MAVIIRSVAPGSPADQAGVSPGETLQAINHHEIYDILDYRFYETNQHLELTLSDPKGRMRTVCIHKPQYDPIGLGFDSYLMDQKHSCRNRCIFCFIDQMPKGMRDTLYFKDDDERLSFLFGNYVTLTNLTEREISRMIQMKISPVNVSVHTTNPDLRVKMMGNRFAGKVLDVLPRFAQAGLRINCQCVLCPGINDGPELARTLSDLESLMPQLESVSLVPVGLTKFRDGLASLRPYTQQEAADTIDLIDSFGNRFVKEYGARTVFASDEFYLTAKRPIPPPEFYEDFAQLESGVGSLACLQDEFLSAWDEAKQFGEVPDFPTPRTVTLATGMAAAPFLCNLLDDVTKTCHNLSCEVIPIRNDFFGERITVAGLVTAGDLIAQLRQQSLGDVLLIPNVMLRHDEDVFLDDLSVSDVSHALQIPVVPVPNDGYQLLDALFGRNFECQNQL